MIHTRVRQKIHQDHNNFFSPLPESPRCIQFRYGQLRSLCVATVGNFSEYYWSASDTRFGTVWMLQSMVVEDRLGDSGFVGPQSAPKFTRRDR
jgi:hypothetical protein